MAPASTRVQASTVIGFTFFFFCFFFFFFFFFFFTFFSIFFVFLSVKLGNEFR